MNSARPNAEDLAALVRAGLLAPSGDNCQPWRFAWAGGRLSVVLDAVRAASLYDVRHTASWMALGALLTNVRLSARARGLETSVELFPSDHPPAAARLNFRPGLDAAGPLWEAVPRRCVNRRPYRPGPLPAPFQAELAEAADVPGVRLDLAAEEPVRGRLAALAARNDRILFENRALHDGLYRWLRWSPREAEASGDGIPAASLELGTLEGAGFRLLAAWPLSRALGAARLTAALEVRSRARYRRSAAIGLLSLDGTRPEDFVRGGEALQRLWLTTTHRGLAFQPITGIVCLLLRCRLARGEGLSTPHRAQVETAGRALERLLPGAAGRTPCLLFRVGEAPAPSGRAPRRAADAVLTVEANG